MINHLVRINLYGHPFMNCCLSREKNIGLSFNAPLLQDSDIKSWQVRQRPLVNNVMSTSQIHHQNVTPNLFF